jgi:hypothetical protein
MTGRYRLLQTRKRQHKGVYRAAVRTACTKPLLGLAFQFCARLWR